MQYSSDSEYLRARTPTPNWHAVWAAVNSVSYRNFAAADEAVPQSLVHVIVSR